MLEILKGYKIIDMTIAGAGPTGGRLLREYGADVILIEPTTGVNSRVWHGLDVYHGDKRCLALNLKDPEGLQTMIDLLKDADGFITSYRAKSLKKLGLDWETLHALNPKLVYGILTGYGEDGPMKDDAGYDTMGYWAMSGIAHTIQDRDGLPIVMPGGVGDTPSGMTLALGMVGGLLNRERTGEGIKVSVSLLGYGIFCNQDAIIEGQYGTEYPRSRKAPRHSTLNTFKCKDGWVSLLILKFEPDFWNIMRALGREDLVGDPRWKKFTDTDYPNSPEIVEIWDEAFAKLTVKEAHERMLAYGIACNKLDSVYDVVHNEQALANGYLFPHVQYDGKEILMPASAVRFGDNTPSANYGSVHHIGEDTVDILHELGYPDEKINAMFARHAIADIDIKFTEAMSDEDLQRALENSRSHV